MSFQIENRKIGLNESPFIIAEMSGNHNQSLERALLIVEAAAKSGAHALKIQTYTADTMTMDSDRPAFMITDEASLWKGQSLYQLYQQAHTPWEWHKPIFEHCRKLGLLAFSTPFDETAVDYLEELQVPAYKVASFENGDLKLIKKIAQTKKPMIVSTGMATLAELDEMVRVIAEAGCQNLLLLKCTSTYPATAENSNLLTIPHLRDLFGLEVGLSDHTLGIGVAVAAIALGAVAVEKHFTLSRADGGVDSAFSLEPSEMKSLVAESKNAWLAKGNIRYGAVGAEEKSKYYRRSLFVIKDLKAGETITSSHIGALRPGLGLPTKYYDLIVGKTAKECISKGTPVSWEIFK